MQYWIELLVAFFSGAAISAVITVKVVANIRSKKTTITQSGNKTGGDIVGGNKNDVRKK